MKIEDSVGYICEFSDEETSMIRQIAERDKLTLENALAKAIQNFLETGVQTPNLSRPLFPA